jgi:hypothetical protein
MPILMYPKPDAYKSTYNGLNSNTIASNYNKEMQKRWENVKYIRFTPKTIQADKETVNKLKKIAAKDITVEEKIKLFKEATQTLNTSKTSFRESLKLSTIVDKETKKSEITTIYLPMKPITVTLSPSWTDGDASVLNTNASVSATLATKVGGGAITKLAANNTYIQTILSQSGKYLAQPHRKYFSGVPGISLPFEWTFSPRNKEEFLTIKKIFKTFQLFSLPSGGKDENSTPVYLRDNPAIWEIQYKDISGSDAKNLISNQNKFEFMVCTNISVQYGNGESWVTFDDGTPVDIKISVTFESFFNTSDSLDVTGYTRNINSTLQSIDQPTSVPRVRTEFK